MQILNDFNTSVRKALDEIDSEWELLDGLVVCGTHSPHDVEAMIEKIRQARESGRPFLGICFGHQLAAVEYARNVMGIADAISEEFGEGTFVVKKRPEGLKVGLHDGESYWNNYEVVPELLDMWAKPKNFITCQFHPEYQSSKDKPHPLLVQFLQLCRK
jgi:CTP synthase (UTP-ammonia lyase)